MPHDRLIAVSDTDPMPKRTAGGAADGDSLQWNDGLGQWEPVAPGVASHPNLAVHDALGLATDAELAAHTGDTSAAHAASAISFTPAGTIAATDVQAAIVEVAAEATDDQTAAEVPFTPVGTIAATDTQAAVAEVATDAASALASHEADTTAVHGIANTGDLYRAGGTDVAVADGGTGASTAAGARTGLGLVIGTDVRAQGSGDPTRASLGLDTGDSPQFAGVNIGTATDTTVTRDAAGDLAVEGNRVYRAGGTDVPVTDGGTGSSTASGARTNLGLVIGTDVPSQAAHDDHSARHENSGADEISIAGLDGVSVELAAHLADTVDAHDASAISIVDAGNYFTGTEVEAALQELGTAAFGGGSAPSNADYLVGTAQGGLSAEIVVGTTPGGELGGTWASPTVDATHSGSTHAGAAAAAVATHEGLADPHTGYRLESADHTHATTGLQGGTVAHAVLTGISATDHHAAPVAGPDADVTIDVAGAAGTASTFARSGHGHKVTTYASAAAALGTAAAGTSGTAPARGDHVHSHGTQAVGLHPFVAPTVVAVGASATSAGGNVTPALPTGHAVNDINLLFVQSSNQAITAPAGWTQLGPAVGFGVAATAGSTRLSAFWRREVGGDADPTVTGAADHTLAVIMGVRGCPTTGDPFESVGQTRKTTASATSTGAAGATSWDNCLVVQAFAHALDSASAAFSSPANASLSSVTEQVDVATADGTGGGIGVITGLLATAGTFGATTSTVTSTVDVGSCFVMLPLGTRPAFDRQIFTTPGFSDTWVKRSGAQLVEMVCIGGGASGSAGRNAATAAGGGGGGGGAWQRVLAAAGELASTMTVVAGAGGAATANSDGAASNVGGQSNVTSAGKVVAFANFGNVAGVSATGSGGLGGNGGGRGVALAASTNSWTIQLPGGGTGGTTAGAGGTSFGMAGGAGAGGGTTQAASAGGSAEYGGAGGGGGRSNTTVGTGGASLNGSQVAGGATAGAAGADSPLATFGGAGGAGGTSAAGPGGAGGWPGGGGGGGGSQAAAQRGGAGGDGVVVIVTTC